jgi:hypothetical protein
MAEALGVVASSLSVAAFAGQLAQGSAFLYTFFKDIENAPDDIRLFSDELQLMTSILSTIHGSSNSGDPGLEQALEHCEQVINELSAVIGTVAISPGLTKWKKLRKQFATAFKRAERMKQLHSLERAKSMLLQCCTTSIRCVICLSHDPTQWSTAQHYQELTTRLPQDRAVCGVNNSAGD